MVGHVLVNILLLSWQPQQLEGVASITQSRDNIVHHEDGTCTIPQRMCTIVEEVGTIPPGPASFTSGVKILISDAL